MPSEIKLLKKRTIEILDAFRSLYPDNDIFKGVDIMVIKNISSKATSGFHELYLKCLVFQHLSKNLNEENFSSLENSAKVMVELLFNPALEVQLLESYYLESLDELLMEPDMLDDIDGMGISFWHDIDERQLEALTKSIHSYITWYNTNKNSIYKNSNNTILADTDDKIISKIRLSNVDINQEEHGHVNLRNGERIGTTGMANCLAIIGIQNSDLEPIVDVTHSTFNFHDSIVDMHSRFENFSKPISVYLIGGHPCHFNELLPLIYNNEFNIADVRLARSISSPTSGCVVTSDGKNSSVYYLGNLAHTHEVKEEISIVTNSQWLSSPIHSPNRKRKLTDELACHAKENSPKRARFDS